MKVEDVEFLFNYVGSAPRFAHSAYLNRRTGEDCITSELACPDESPALLRVYRADCELSTAKPARQSQINVHASIPKSLNITACCAVDVCVKAVKLQAHLIALS